MMLSDVNIDNKTNETIKDILFSIHKGDYDKADCMIIFGCHLKPILDERIKVALDVLKKKEISKILLTGGIGVNGNFNESEYMRKILLKNDISEKNILIENESTTTEENISNSIKILKDNDLIQNKKLVLVSSTAHLRRISMELKKRLSGFDYEIIYEYPELSLISYDNIIKNKELRVMAVNEIKKIIKFVNKGIIDNEIVYNIKPLVFDLGELKEKANNGDKLSCYLLGRSYDSAENGAN